MQLFIVPIYLSSWHHAIMYIISLYFLLVIIFSLTLRINNGRRFDFWQMSIDKCQFFIYLLKSMLSINFVDILPLS